MNYCSALWNNDGLLTAHGVAGSITARDDEQWPLVDQVGRLDVDRTLMVASDNPSGNVIETLCVGDELRIEVEFQPAVLEGSSIVMVVATRMYEGSSCDTDDLEDGGNLAERTRFATRPPRTVR